MNVMNADQFDHEHKFIREEEEYVCVKCGLCLEIIEDLPIKFVDNERFMDLNYYGNIDLMTKKLAISNVIKGYGRYKRLGVLHQRLSYREKDILIYRVNKILQEKFKIPYHILIDANKEYQKYLKEKGKNVNLNKFCKIILSHIRQLNLTEDRIKEIKLALVVNLHLKKLK